MADILEHLSVRAQQLCDNRRRWADRFLAECQFAGALGDLLKERSWRALVDRAAAGVVKSLVDGRLDQLPAAVRAAEKMLAPIGKQAKRYTLHCVGHGHIDMNWMWSWPETVATTNDTFLTVLRLMDEFDDFCYTQSQASVYRIVREHNPELFEQIRQRVAEGRWEAAAVNWVEAEQNIAGGEALARHLLYTRRYMRELFGLSPEDAPVQWMPDTFGHAWTIPTVASRGRVRFQYMCRGGQLIDKPPVFWWQGPDGSRILVNLETTWYNDSIGPHSAGKMLAFCAKTGLRDWLNVYGVGDHGGGPTRRDIVRGHEMNDWPIYPNFRFTTARPFYELLAKEGRRWPVVKDELNLEFAGCYTTQTQIKRHNRRAESELAIAESAAVVGLGAIGRAYPTAHLTEGWINTLFGQFHDILPGSGVRATREYQSGLYQQTAAATGAIKTNTLRALAAAVDTAALAAGTDKPDAESIALGAGPGRGSGVERITDWSPITDGPRPFLVFNPTAWSRTEVVTLVIWDGGAKWRDGAVSVRSADGTVSAAQRVNKGNYWGHDFVELAVPVIVGPMGYTTLVAEPGTGKALAAPATAKAHRMLETGPASPAVTLENEFTLVEIDRASGGIARLLDKASGAELARPGEPMGVLEYVCEQPGEMSSWTIYPPAETICPLPVESVRAPLGGPAVASVVVKGRIKDSTYTVAYSLRAGQPGVAIGVQVQWVERGGPSVGTPGLRMKFPTALSDATGRYEIPFGSIERTLNAGQEVPALRWAEIRGTVPRGAGRRGRPTPASLAVLNDSKYGHSLEGSALRVTLIRSSYDPDPLPEIGEHNVQFVLQPGGPAVPVAERTRAGTELNLPLQVVATDLHAGELETAGAAVTVAPSNVLLVAVKKAEDSNAIVLRLVETAGQSATARVQFDPALLAIGSNVVEVDLLEASLAKSSAKAIKDGFTVRVPAFGLSSVQVGLLDRGKRNR